jgi:hypothetical protein
MAPKMPASDAEYLIDAISPEPNSASGTSGIFRLGWTRMNP